jgi:Arc/MetJ-type ribon-helix-helix transcriptional regulator
MPLITVRVDGETKEKMDLVSINWSEAIRSAISEILQRETRRNRIRAAQLTDRIRIRAPKGWDSTKVIRAWRDARYGPRR